MREYLSWLVLGMGMIVGGASALGADSTAVAGGNGSAVVAAGNVSAAAPVAGVSYSPKQLAALGAVTQAECAASAALAGEDWAAWEKARTGLFNALMGLNAVFSGEAFQGAVKGAVAAWAGLQQAGDMTHARSAFVKVSDNIAQVVWLAKAGDPALGKVVVYYCPMTSEPADGRWVQSAPPLQNPFWGKDMRDCGAEYKPGN